MTPELEDLIKGLKLIDAKIDIQCKHTTAGLIVNEDEKGIIYDLENAGERLAPRSVYHRHDDFAVREVKQPDERTNGPAHQMAILLLPETTVYVKDSKLDLGTYQSVMLVDLDGRKRKREVVLYCEEIGIVDLRRKRIKAPYSR